MTRWRLLSCRLPTVTGSILRAAICEACSSLISPCCGAWLQVRDFEVIEGAPYSVVCSWQKEDGSPHTQALFERNSAVPKTKMLTFMRNKPFSVTLAYGDDNELPGGTSQVLGEYSVGAFEVPAGAEKAKLKVRKPPAEGTEGIHVSRELPTLIAVVPKRPEDVYLGHTGLSLQQCSSCFPFCGTA